MQSPKSYFQGLLKRLGLYHRFKASPLYNLYWSIADRSIVQESAAEFEFYRDLLRGFQRGDIIFDIGANHGFKTAVFLRLGARVVAVDPDETNKTILEDKFLRYRLVSKPLVIVNQAVSDTTSVATMWIDEPGSAKNTLNSKWVDTLRVDESRFGQALTFGQRKEVLTTTLEELIASHGVPFFIKIDVEGYELNVLKGLRQPVRYLSFEINLPEFLSEGLQCVELLGQTAAAGMFNYGTDVRRGMALKEWLGPKEFASVLTECSEDSIEVFWKTSPAPSV